MEMYLTRGRRGPKDKNRKRERRALQKYLGGRIISQRLNNEQRNVSSSFPRPYSFVNTLFQAAIGPKGHEERQNI